MAITSSQKEWLSGLRDNVHGFMASLQVHHQPGRFKPCPLGSCDAGEKAALGFSCFAHKIYYSLGLLETLSPQDQTAWLDFIRAFQKPEGIDPHGRWSNAFIDPGLLHAIQKPPYLGIQLTVRRFLAGIKPPQPKEDAIRAETKQAIATLAQVGANPRYPFPHFPLKRRPLRRELDRFDWSQPWTAGAKTALFAVFIQTQAPLLEQVDQPSLVKTMVRFLETIVHPESGSYYRGKQSPPRGQMINGAMKVLNALDWLNQPIHYPERLIDTTLEQGPPPAGCHVVDWIYVIHRCSLQTDHRKTEIQNRCLDIIDLIKTHQNRDQGFSYQPHQAQTKYYNATISQGLDEGDIHGSCLLIWALTMIAALLEWELPGWKIIRP